MAATQHYLWAGGHFLLLLCSARYLLAYVTFKSAHYTWWYNTAFLGALLSYAIVCYKALGVPNLTAAFTQKALVDENVQYFLLASIWWFSKPIPIALLPYMVFSLFHALTFLRTTVLPKIIPPPATPAGATPATPQQSQIAKTIQTWVKSNYDGAMRVTAFAELVILFRVTLGALTLQNSLWIPIVYVYFVRQRYYHSLFTREAVAKAHGWLDGHLSGAAVHPTIKQGWSIFQKAVKAWTGNVIALQPANSTNRRTPTPRA